MGGICAADRILIVPNKYASKIIHVDVINNIQLSFIQGDICEEDVEAIVNGADSLMRNQNSSIVERAGREEIAKEHEGNVTDSRPLEFGKSFLTTAGNLKAKFIIHLSIPVWAGGQYNELGLLGNCFDDAFNIIKEKQIKIVGITDVSSGMFGIPAKLGREVLIKSLLNWICSQKDQNYINEIRIVHYEFSSIKKFAEDFRAAKLEKIPINKEENPEKEESLEKNQENQSNKN